MTAPRIKAVIFDMDGLLLDTEGIYTQVTQLISDRYGGRTFDWQFKQNTIGLGAYDLASYIVQSLQLPISRFTRRVPSPLFPEEHCNAARRAGCRCADCDFRRSIAALAFALSSNGFRQRIFRRVAVQPLVTNIRHCRRLYGATLVPGGTVSCKLAGLVVGRFAT